MAVYKHVLTVTILSPYATVEESFGDKWDLADVENKISDGDCIGCVEVESSSKVPAHNVVKELLEIDHDGSFFDDLTDEENEQQRRDEKNGLYSEHDDPCN